MIAVETRTSGLTSQQQWTHDHISRCTCGSWVVLTEWQRRQLADDVRPACPHINPAAMERAS